jgi:RND superfamily putative drug exporter
MFRTAQQTTSGVAHGNGADPSIEREAATPEPANFTARAARWSATHRKTAVLGWLAFVVVAFMIGQAAGLVTLKPEEIGNGQSRLADQTLAQQFPRRRASEVVLLESRSGTLASSGYRTAVGDLVARLSRTPAVAAIKSPLAPGNQGQIAKNGRAALLTFQITGDPATAKDRVGRALAATAAVQAAHPNLFIGEFGQSSAEKAINKRIAQDFQRAEVTSLPVTLFILVLAFGALVAAGVPLLLGVTATVAALGLTELLSHLLHVQQMISSVILLIGLAVGIDYSLFYLRREREERAKGRTPADALQVAAATSGRAILISGFTVIIAMTGMFLMGSQIFTSFGIGTVLVVAIALLGSLTVLPAVLSKLGDRVDRGRIPFLQRRRTRDGESRAWAAIVAVVLRRPLLWGGAALALLVALAIPAFSLHTVNAGAQGVPDSLAVKQVYNRIQKTFPGGSLPAIVVISAPDVTKPQITSGIAALKRAALATGVMHQPISEDVSSSRQAARVMVPLAGKGTDNVSVNALQRLRNDVIPATIGKVPGVTVHTTGWVAGTVDMNNSMKSHAPLVFAWVLGLAFLLLLVTFRSIVIPITSIALNLLSVGAAYGVLVLIFQQGHLQSLLGFTSIGGVTDWLPLFLFVVLFGLSMDYHVLILSRIREMHDRGMSTENAIATGIKTTAGVITSAAIVMVAVFAIFATLEMLDFKMMGVGLATAILIDATIVRAVLLPATMKLLGKRNWYLPRWLNSLPHLATEPTLGRVSTPVAAVKTQSAAVPTRPIAPARQPATVSDHSHAPELRDDRRHREPGALAALGVTRSSIALADQSVTEARTEPEQRPPAAAVTPNARSGWTAGRIAKIVAGGVLTLIAVGALAGGAYGAWLHTTQRSNGYVMTSSERFATGSYALATRTLHISSDVPSFLYGRDWLGNVRIRGKSTNPNRPLFIGIARKHDVDRYLAGVAHSDVVDVSANLFATTYRPSYRAQPGGKPPTPPNRASFWVASVAGRGNQTLTWSVKPGRWAVVVMRPDGSRGVSAELAAGAKLPALVWASIGLGVLGLLILGGAAALIYSGARNQPAPTPPAG